MNRDWLVEALRDKSFTEIDREELSVRNAFRGFLDPFMTGRDNDFRLLLERVERLEQYHCEHEFSDHGVGCTASIFCSKCGALHPDWERTFPHRFGFAPSEKPVGYLIVDGKHYRTKASKPKEE